MSREIKFRAWHKNIKEMCQNVKTDLLDRDYLEFDNCWNDDVYPLCQLHWESNADEDVLYNCEVKGNIYENPQLLEQKSNQAI